MNTALAAFQPGDPVTLVKGSTRCTLGVFLRLNADPAWASIEENNGVVRSHPTAWLAPVLDTPWGRNAAARAASGTGTTAAVQPLEQSTPRTKQ